MSRTIVVKVGGSLLDWPEFPTALRAFARSIRPARAVLVVGGGAVVEALRTFDSVHAIGEAPSHELALRALDVTARVVASIVGGLRVVESPEAVADAWNADVLPLLSPWWWMEHRDRTSPDPLPRRWTTTSDSVAARIARDLPADELVLLKSTWPGGPEIPRDRAARTGFVDVEFPRASAHLDRVGVVNLRESTRFSGYLV